MHSPDPVDLCNYVAISELLLLWPGRGCWDLKCEQRAALIWEVGTEIRFGVNRCRDYLRLCVYVANFQCTLFCSIT